MYEPRYISYDSDHHLSLLAGKVTDARSFELTFSKRVLICNYKNRQIIDKLSNSTG